MNRQTASWRSERLTPAKPGSTTRMRIETEFLRYASIRAGVPGLVTRQPLKDECDRGVALATERD